VRKCAAQLVCPPDRRLDLATWAYESQLYATQPGVGFCPLSPHPRAPGPKEAAGLFDMVMEAQGFRGGGGPVDTALDGARLTQALAGKSRRLSRH